MSTVFGAVRQIGYVTRDIEAGMSSFLRCGIGPWFYLPDNRLADYRYRGVRHELHMSIALANSGDVQFELVQQNNDAPSLYRDWLEQHQHGTLAQHVSSWPVDYAAALARGRAAGYEVAMEGLSAFGPWAYMQHPDDPGRVFEIAEETPQRRAVCDGVRQAALAWDGSDPVRRGLPA